VLLKGVSGVRGNTRVLASKGKKKMGFVPPPGDGGEQEKDFPLLQKETAPAPSAPVTGRPTKDERK